MQIMVQFLNHIFEFFIVFKIIKQQSRYRLKVHDAKHMRIYFCSRMIFVCYIWNFIILVQYVSNCLMILMLSKTNDIKNVPKNTVTYNDIIIIKSQITEKLYHDKRNEWCTKWIEVILISFKSLQSRNKPISQNKQVEIKSFCMKEIKWWTLCVL